VERMSLSKHSTSSPHSYPSELNPSPLTGTYPLPDKSFKPPPGVKNEVERDDSQNSRCQDMLGSLSRLPPAGGWGGGGGGGRARKQCDRLSFRSFSVESDCLGTHGRGGMYYFLLHNVYN